MGMSQLSTCHCSARANMTAPSFTSNSATTYTDARVGASRLQMYGLVLTQPFFSGWLL